MCVKPRQRLVTAPTIVGRSSNPDQLGFRGIHKAPGRWRPPPRRHYTAWLRRHLAGTHLVLRECCRQQSLAGSVLETWTWQPRTMMWLEKADASVFAKSLSHLLQPSKPPANSVADAHAWSKPIARSLPEVSHGITAPKAGKCPLAGVGKDIDDVWRRDRITQRIHGGCGQEST